MCMQDYRMGEATQSKQLYLQQNGAITEVLPQDNHRRMIILGSPSAATLTYGTDPAMVTGRGFNLNNGERPIILRRDDYGDEVTKAWFAVATAGNPFFSVGYSQLIEENLKPS